MYDDRPSEELPAGVAARLVELDRSRRGLEAEIAATVAETQRTAEYGADGHTTVAAWCRCLTGCSTEQANTWRRLAHLTNASPAIADALHASVLGVEQAHVLAKAYANPRCGATLADVIPILLEHASALSMHEFRLIVRRWEILADTDGAHHDSDAVHANRNAWITEHGGLFRFGGSCGPAQGAVLQEIWDRFTAIEDHADFDAARTEHGTVTAGNLVRTRPQRRLDALVEMATAAASTPPDAQRPLPLVNLVADLSTVEHLLDLDHDTGHNAGEGSPPSPDPLRRRCETIDGTPITPRDMLAAMLVGHVRRVVTDSAGVIIDFGRKRRMFTGPARDAVLLASSRCCWAGCHRPTTQCHTDHLVEWRHHGSTNLANGAPLCRWHNIFKSVNHYRTWRDPTGHWHSHRPNNTDITEPSPDPDTS